MDKDGIAHLCGLFFKVDLRLGDAFCRHFCKSCRDPYYLQGKAFKFPRGWLVSTGREEGEGREGCT